jgi:hypothetical protein
MNLPVRHRAVFAFRVIGNTIAEIEIVTRSRGGGTAGPGTVSHRYRPERALKPWYRLGPRHNNP